MKTSKPSIARTLLLAACPTLVVAGTVASPEGAALAAAAAGVLAIPALLSGTRAMRVFAGVLLIGALALASASFPSAKRSTDAYRERAHRQPVTGETPESRR